MIDTSKTVGSAETFDPEKINALLSQGVINNVANLEKAIFSLEYLGQLQEEGLDFIFKGGSAIQVILRDKWTRLSVDADICSAVSEGELIGVFNNIHQKFKKEIFSFRPREREILGDVPFYHYIIEAPAITEAKAKRTFLLDVMGIKPKYSVNQVKLKTSFYDSSVSVFVPTVGALLGDKLSTIGPCTMGRRLVDSRNGLEYAKHFHDIKNLQEADFNVEDYGKAFHEAIELQRRIRCADFSVSACCEDLLFTCQVASLPQQTGEELIQKLQGDQRSRASSEFRILRDGLARFRPFLVRGLTYSWDELRYYASLTALLTKMLQMGLSEEKVKTILRSDIPTNKEEIAPIISRIEGIDEEDRWFIQSDEIVNFPRLLKTWHDYFFLDENS